MSGSNRGRRVAAAGVGGAALLGAAGFGAWQYTTRPSIAQVSPAPGVAVPTTTPDVVVRVNGTNRLNGLRVRVNGKDLTAAVRAANDRLIIPTSGLRDGAQSVDVSFHTGNLFGRTVRRSWTFDVDTAPPALTAATPAPGALSTTHAVRFTGTTEPGAKVAVTWKGGKAAGTATPTGTFAVTARLPEGEVRSVLSAADRAGNTTTADRAVQVDTIAPAIALDTPKSGSVLTDTAAPRFTGVVVKDTPQNLTFGATVNGRKAIELPGASALPATPESGLVEAAASTGAPLEIAGKRFSLAVGDLPQGINTVKVWAKDPAGNVATATTRVMVNSTEEFGTGDIRLGARGEDVVTLNNRLKQARVLRGKATATFGPTTRLAVMRYQARHKLPRTGVVDARTRNAMVGRIVVDLSQYTLRLIRDGRVVAKYKVAVGQPAYPTPTGTFKVVNKQTNPTWMPPSSPWAKGLGPIPPGPGNPLGTRWIGTSAPAVGIHGTYADYSIGTAASHGCMRMHIPDVEKLFEEVVVGMPVIIKA